MDFFTDSLEKYAITKDTVKFKSCLYYSHDLIINQINQIHLNNDSSQFEEFYSNLKYTNDLLNHYKYEFDHFFHSFLSSIINHLNNNILNYLKNNYELSESVFKFFNINLKDSVLSLQYYLNVYQHILENIPDKSSKRRKIN